MRNGGANPSGICLIISSGDLIQRGIPQLIKEIRKDFHKNSSFLIPNS